jgi:hypothetical protein
MSKPNIVDNEQIGTEGKKTSQWGHEGDHICRLTPELSGGVAVRLERNVRRLQRDTLGRR